MNKYEAMHQRNLVRYAKQIDEIFEEAAREAARMVVSVEDIMERLNKELFAFRDYPMLNERIDALMEKLHDDIEICVLNGVEHEWTLANSKHNELSRRVFGDNIGRLTDAQYQRYFNNHGEALDAFKGRQVAGLNLSDRVWNYTDMFKEQIEAALTVSLGQGKAANCVATELKQYLKYPDKLFRRVKDENGNLVPSKAMEAFHPGQGVYRSSYMNARRLAVTETNMAYRTSDHLRIQDEDFVVGIKIVLSNNHTIKSKDGKGTVRLVDICDELQGEYPKDFKFTGWHPHCRCHIETVLKTDKEIDADFDKILNGQDIHNNSVNQVYDVPANFKKWLIDNEERSKKQYSIPYFMRDNMGKYVPEKYIQAYASKMPYKTYAEYEQAMQYNKKHAHFTKAVEENNAEISRILPIKQGKIMTIDQADQSNVNPYYQNADALVLGYRHNCQTCTVGYLLRKRGFNVDAFPNIIEKSEVKDKITGLIIQPEVRNIDRYFAKQKTDWKHRFLNENGTAPDYNFTYGGDAKLRKSFMNSQTNESGTYEIYCKWKDEIDNKGKVKTGGAHVFIAERTEDGKLIFIDPQSGKKGGISSSFMKYYLDDMEYCGIMRIDDKIINTKMLGRFNVEKF